MNPDRPLLISSEGVGLTLFWRRLQPAPAGALVLALLFIAGGNFSCSRAPQQTTSGPVYEYVHKGYGGVVALATGSDPSGRELLVAGEYEFGEFAPLDSWVFRLSPEDGHPIWKDYFPGIQGMVESTALDPAGNVLVGWDHLWPIFLTSQADNLLGWEHFLLDDRNPPLVTKLSGTDGSILWEWRNPTVSAARLLKTSRINAFCPDAFDQKAVVTPDRFGRVWVAGVRGDGKGMQIRYLAILDAQTGRQIWSRDLNADFFVRPVSVQPLADGDAVVVREPDDKENWLCERVRASDGSAAWKKEFPYTAVPGRWPQKALKIQWVIDEARKQIAFFWDVEGVSPHTMLGNSEVCDLVTGATKWRNSFESDYQRYSRFATLEPGGDFVLWETREWYSCRINWGNWGKTLGIWLPEFESVFHLRTYRTTISGTDGRELKREPIASEGEELSNVMAAPGKPGDFVLFLRQNSRSAGPVPWRTQRFGGTTGPEASGTAFDESAPVVITPSGRIVTTHLNRDDDDKSWRIILW